MRNWTSSTDRDTNVAAYPAPPRRDARIRCGCCHRDRAPGGLDHPVLGPLCVACSYAFDDKPHAHMSLPDWPASAGCPFCALGECERHG